MKTRVVAFAFALLAGTAGCKTENHASIEVFGICGPPEDAETCSTSGECETFFAGRPTVFTMAESAFFPGVIFENELNHFMQVNNQLPNNADPSAGRVNTNDAIIESYEFSFDVRGTFDAIGAFFQVSIPDLSYPAVSTIPANGSFTPNVPLIPRAQLKAISDEMFLNGDDDSLATVIVSLRMKGHLEDGTEFETAEHEYAIDVIDMIAAAPVCPIAGEEVVAICPHEGQDFTFVCAEP
jgi:hypothetical protein